MRDIRNLNIWKEENVINPASHDYYSTDILDLNLSVRSYNCLKRAGCHTVGDILQYMDEDGQGLRRIRNLGSRSETEILEKIEQIRDEYAKHPPIQNGLPNRVIIKPGKRVWDRRIDEFLLSRSAMTKFRECGIRQVRDLYTGDMDKDPGWPAVRELFKALI